MIAEAQNLVAHVGHVCFEIIGVRAIAGVGLEELIPEQDAVLVAELIEVFAGALSDPVADQVEMRQLVHVDLGIEALPRNALEAFVQPPVAAANEYADPIDGDGEVFRVGHRVGNLAHTKGDVLRVGRRVVLVKAEMQLVEVLRAIAVGPPQARIFDVEGGRGLAVEPDRLRAVGRDLDRLFEGDVLDGPLENALLRLVGNVFDGRLHGHIG